MAPLPSPVVMTGACRYSASSVSSAEASEDITPPQPSMSRRVSNLLNYIIGKEEKKDNDKYIELHQHDEST